MGCSNTTSTFKIETLSPQQPVKIVNQLVPQIVVVNRVGNQGHFSMNQGMRDMSRLSIVSCQSNNNHRNFVEVNKREGRSFERSPARLV